MHPNEPSIWHSQIEGSNINKDNTTRTVALLSMNNINENEILRRNAQVSRNWKSVMAFNGS